MILITDHKHLRASQRIRRKRLKLARSREILNFAQVLNLSGVSAKAKARSILAQYPGTSTREARLALDLAKPKKRRRRAA